MSDDSEKGGSSFFPFRIHATPWKQLQHDSLHSYPIINGRSPVSTFSFDLPQMRLPSLSSIELVHTDELFSSFISVTSVWIDEIFHSFEICLISNLDEGSMKSVTVSFLRSVVLKFVPVHVPHVSCWIPTRYDVGHLRRRRSCWNIRGKEEEKNRDKEFYVQDLYILCLE